MKKKEGRSSFLKKRSKKLLSLGYEQWAIGSFMLATELQKFFASFFQKRSAFFLPFASAVRC